MIKQHAARLGREFKQVAGDTWQLMREVAASPARLNVGLLVLAAIILITLIVVVVVDTYQITQMKQVTSFFTVTQ